MVYNSLKLTKQRQIIDRLLKAKGISKYVIFEFSEDEEEKLPNNVPTCSGTILTIEGKVYGFWLSWNKKKKIYTLGEDKTYKGNDGKEYPCWGEENPINYAKHKWQFVREEFADAKAKLGLL